MGAVGRVVVSDTTQDVFLDLKGMSPIPLISLASLFMLLLAMPAEPDNWLCNMYTESVHDWSLFANTYHFMFQEPYINLQLSHPEHFA